MAADTDSTYRVSLPNVTLERELTCKLVYLIRLSHRSVHVIGSISISFSSICSPPAEPFASAWSVLEWLSKYKHRVGWSTHARSLSVSSSTIANYSTDRPCPIILDGQLITWLQRRVDSLASSRLCRLGIQT